MNSRIDVRFNQINYFTLPLFYPDDWQYVGSGYLMELAYDEINTFEGSTRSKSKMYPFLETLFRNLETNGFISSYEIDKN